MTVRLLIVALLCLPGFAHAAPEPCSASEYGEFDFWNGFWEVRSPDGQLQGTNRISKTEGNCLIVERWHSAAGGTGQSYNYFTAADRR